MGTKRFSINIGEELNDWLDEESEKTGFTKNALCHMAIERYREQREGMNNLKALNSFNELLEAMRTTDTDLDLSSFIKGGRN